MGLAILIFGLMVFLGSHLFITRHEARDAAIARLGLAGYRALFAIAASAGLAMIVWGFSEYRADGLIQIWSPTAFMRHVTIDLMLIAVILFVAAFVPSHIQAKTKYTVLAGIKTWAFAHLLSNGDLGGTLLFGSFLGWGVYARIADKRRGNPGVATAPADWSNDFIVLALGIVIYIALGYAFHPILIGVPVFGR